MSLDSSTAGSVEGLLSPVGGQIHRPGISSGNDAFFRIFRSQNSSTGFMAWASAKLLDFACLRFTIARLLKGARSAWGPAEAAEKPDNEPGARRAPRKCLRNQRGC
jgi:hypothetical protein